MPAQQRYTIVSLSIFLLILAFFSLRIFQMVQGAAFTPPNVFQLWVIVIIASVVGTVSVTIISSIVWAIIYTIRNKEEPKDQEWLEDERDKLIGLKGTRVTYVVNSLGALGSMLTFSFGQPPLVMFTLLIASGLFAQVVGDVYRLYCYRRGI